jgi:enoyl-CoA hydratase
MPKMVQYEQENEVAVITLDDGKANAFGFDMIAELNASLDRASSEARAVVFTGRAGILSGGFDLKVVQGDDAAAAKKLTTLGGRLMMRVYGHPQPVVMAATGHAIALGAFFLLAADHRLSADNDSKIGLNEASIGAPLPEFALTLTRDRLSKRHVARAALGATMFSPSEAVDAGFLDEVVAADNLRKSALEHAMKLAAYNGQIYAQIKMGLRGESIAKVEATLA